MLQVSIAYITCIVYYAILNCKAEHKTGLTKYSNENIDWTFVMD